MKFTLPLQAVINAQKCTATNDIRDYLNGFHVTNKVIQATNGHFLYQATFKEIKYPDYLAGYLDDFELPDSIVIKVTQPIKKPPAKLGCAFVIFEVEESRVIATIVDKFGNSIEGYLGEVIDCKFPDTERVIPRGEPDYVPQIGFNSAHLKKVDQVSDGGRSLVRLKTFGEHKATVFEILSFNEHYDAIFLLMPIRL